MSKAYLAQQALCMN